LAKARLEPPLVCAIEGWRPKEVLFYPISIRERLPTIRIPLRRSDKQVRLDVQAVYDLAYENGEYGADIDYTRPPDKVPLSPEESVWMHDHLLAKGLRK
jgi:hypothetical protein